ncbi:acyl carrier protein [Desulfotalea psychrophila]|uniref:Acyl carrier protein n=1 Tax=Desulfotalea psychrophila (strain LSv54 / DSM 12343) TaxID=177439 RepID=Q6AM38_DESPS|nr:acyl carrier protein [Desulfotalea psychrophila]CAG36587.1 related to acyl carrier protein [Desulfotalea psychrophila LSv54]
MTDKEVFQTVVDVLAEEFELNREEMTPEASLYEELGLDSLDAVDMVIVLEKTFGLKLADEKEIRSIWTLKDLAEFIVKKKAGQTAA